MYFIYLDESGISRINRNNVREEADFFVLGGIFIKEEDLLECIHLFTEFKKSKFPEQLQNYPIHAVELNHISRNEKTKYKGIFSDEQGKKLLQEIYDFLNTLKIEAIAVIVDNFLLKEKYCNPANPYYLSYEFLTEKIQKIISKRNESHNIFGMIHLSECSETLTREIKRIHGNFVANGTKYSDFKNILPNIIIERNTKSCFYEIADLVCYAFQRCYYAWLCQNLNKMEIKEDYLSKLNKICTTNIGKILLNEKFHVKVFPEPRFIKKETK